MQMVENSWCTYKYKGPFIWFSNSYNGALVTSNVIKY